MKNLSSDDLTFPDWFEVAAMPRYTKPELNDHALNGYLWPVGVRYETSVPFASMSVCGSMELLNQRDFWIARDGVIPLNWFFTKFPAPVKLKSKIYLHEAVLEWVPEAWKKSVGFYRLASAKAPNPKTQLLLTGVGIRSYCDGHELKPILEAIKKDFPNPEAVRSFIPMREDAFSNEFHHEYIPEFCFELARNFGLKIQPIHWDDFEKTNDYSQFCVADINSYHYLCDSYLVHSALSKGASLWSPQNGTKKGTKNGAAADQILSLSLNHRIELFDGFPKGVQKKSFPRWAMPFQNEVAEKYTIGGGPGFEWPRQYNAFRSS
ncbi:MAG: hypothetical protein JNL01_00565 [Bdellovibrionales bacterium]|nr:hypothetical protein [Bdellovibrionales bacterium]